MPGSALANWPPGRLGDAVAVLGRLAPNRGPASAMRHGLAEGPGLAAPTPPGWSRRLAGWPTTLVGPRRCGAAVPLAGPAAPWPWPPQRW
jgi:hypothetical protein